jgi:5-methylthioadenosine/S-adenosylhomocysteine deaminase
MGVWDNQFEPPGTSPVEYYDEVGLLSDRYVAVHLTDASPDEIDLLARRGAGVILSPTSNLHITGALPDVERIVRTGMRVGIGTDGRGSNPGIDVFDEARLLHERFPGLPAGALLRALTAGGADLLGFEGLGRLRPGRHPGLIAIEVDNAGEDTLESVEHAILTSPKRVRIDRTVV